MVPGAVGARFRVGWRRHDARTERKGSQLVGTKLKLSVLAGDWGSKVSTAVTTGGHESHPWGQIPKQCRDIAGFNGDGCQFRLAQNDGWVSGDHHWRHGSRRGWLT